MKQHSKMHKSHRKSVYFCWYTLKSFIVTLVLKTVPLVHNHSASKLSAHAIHIGIIVVLRVETYGLVQHHERSGWRGGLPLQPLSWRSGRSQTESRHAPPETKTDPVAHSDYNLCLCHLIVGITKIGGQFNSWITLYYCVNFNYLFLICFANFSVYSKCKILLERRLRLLCLQQVTMFTTSGINFKGNLMPNVYF